MWCCLCDPTLSRFSRTPTCDGQTDRRADTGPWLVPRMHSIAAVNLCTNIRRNASCFRHLHAVSITAGVGWRSAAWNRHIGSFRIPASIDTGLRKNLSSPHISSWRQCTDYPHNLSLTTSSYWRCPGSGTIGEINMLFSSKRKDVADVTSLGSVIWPIETRLFRDWWLWMTFKGLT